MAFLLLVFVMNIVVALSGAIFIYIYIAFITSQHRDSELIKVYTHFNRNKHKYHFKANQLYQHKIIKDGEENNENYNNEVLKISRSEKFIPQKYLALSLTFYKSFILIYYNLNDFYPSQKSKDIKYFFKNYHPPISNIRIAMQSFQI